MSTPPPSVPSARSRALGLALAVAALLALVLPGTAEAKTVRIKLATLAPEGSTWYDLLAEMGERWSEASDGQVKLQIFAGGTAGAEGDVLRKIRVGHLHAATLSASGLRDISDREIQTMQVPGLIETDAELDEVWEKLGPRFEKALQKNDFQPLQWGEIGWGHFFSKEPLVTPADASKFKIFSIVGDQGVADIYQALGFTPVIIPATNMIPALKTGMIDLTISAPYAALSLRWFEEANYMTDLRVMPLVGGTVVTKKVWDRIPAELQPKLLAISNEIGKKTRELVRQQDVQALATMKEKGLHVVELTDEQRAAWKKTLREEAWSGARGAVVPEDVFDEIKTTVEQFRASH